MKNDPDIGHIAIPSNRTTSFFWLDSTLENYEVEELDGYELAKFLSEAPTYIERQGDPETKGEHSG